MTTTIDIGHGEFVFSAAHSGLHDGIFERLHGHTFAVSLHLSGTPDSKGMIVDFSAVKQALRTVLGPFHKRTLVAGDAPRIEIHRTEGQVVIDGGSKYYSLPDDDVLILPIANTTTEAIATYLLDQLLLRLPARHGAVHVKLELAESADTAVSVEADL